MRALRRAAGAPGLLLGLWLFKLALAFVLAAPVRAVLEAAIQPHAYTGDASGIVMALGELLGENEAAAAAVAAAVFIAAILGGLLWVVAAGGVITRLARQQTIGETLGASLVWLPRVAVVTVYAIVPRALFLYAASLASEETSVRIVVVLVGWMWCTLALDRARARLVLTDPAPRAGSMLDNLQRTGPISSAIAWWLGVAFALVGAFLDVARQPKVTAGAALAWLLGLAAVAATLLAALHGVGQGWVLWTARGLSLAGVFLVLWRVAVAVEAEKPDA